MKFKPDQIQNITIKQQIKKSLRKLSKRKKNSQLKMEQDALRMIKN